MTLAPTATMQQTAVMRLLHLFQTYGWARLQGAFSADQAAAMREAVWRVLSRRGIRRDNPATWREERLAT